MNKIFAPLLGVALAAANTPAFAQPVPGVRATAEAKSTAVDPAALAVARQILSIGIPEEKRPQMFASVMDSIADQTRKASENLGLTTDKDFQALLARTQQRMWEQMRSVMNASLPDIFDSMAHAYARQFSTDDLNAILAFVKTPSGQHFFERSSTIINDPDVQLAQQRMLAQITSKLPEIMRQNKQDLEDYVAKKKQEKAEPLTPVT